MSVRAECSETAPIEPGRPIEEEEDVEKEDEAAEAAVVVAAVEVAAAVAANSPALNSPLISFLCRRLPWRLLVERRHDRPYSEHE